MQARREEETNKGEVVQLPELRKANCPLVQRLAKCPCCPHCKQTRYVSVSMK